MQKSDAIAYFGSQRALAKALGITEQAVSGWKPDKIPELRAVQLHILTNGELKADPSSFLGLTVKQA